LYLSAAAESQTVRTTIPLRLCALARRKKENIIGAQSRQGAKSLSEADRQALREEKTLFLPFKNPVPSKFPELS
jgi:hypothetical protein